MKIPRISVRFSAVLAVLSLAAVAATLPALLAQSPGGAPNAQNIAVIDIAKILKNGDKYKQELANMQAEIIAAEKEIDLLAKDIQSLGAQQKTYAPGTPDYNRLDAEITRKTADLNVQKSMKQKEFVEKQAKMLLGAYREIQDAVKEFSQRYNIGLVVQYDTNPVDPANPQSILSAAHQNVVYVNPGLDITNDIMANLNRSATRVGDNRPQGPMGIGVPGGSPQGTAGYPR